MFTPNANDPNALFTVSEYGSKEFTWTELNGTCSDASAITVNFYEQSVANAGAGGDECDLDFQLQATPSVGTGTWTMTSGTGTALFTPNANDPNAVVTVSEYGTKEFTWTELNGTCSDAASITVNFYEQPVSDPGAGGDECDLDFQLQATPSVGMGTWTMTTGTGTALFTPNANDPNALFTVSEYGSKEFTWTELNGTCSDASAITVNFYEQPVANAGAGGDECDLDFQLQATPSVGTGTWTMTAGTGTALFSPNANDPNAVVTVSEYGSKEFTWTELNGTCSDASAITVNFYSQPVADAGVGGDECDLDFQLQATPGVGTGTWTMSAGTGTALFTPDANDPSALVTVSAYGTKEFTWTELNGTCSDASAITVNFYEQPVSDAGPDQILEFEFSTLLEGNVPEFGTGQWSIIRGSGQFLNENDPGTEVTDLALGENEFVWILSSEMCEDVSDNVVIKVNDIVTPTVITPNGDGQNDFLVFPGIGQLESNELMIYNRWGTEVYQSPDYQNDWDGRDKKGRELIPDTYYYILRLTPERVIKGFIEIRR